MEVSFVTIKIEVQSLNTEAVAKVYFQGGESPIIKLGTLDEILHSQGEMGDRLFRFLFQPENQDDPPRSLFKWLDAALSTQDENQRLRLQIQINEAPCVPCIQDLDDAHLLKKDKLSDRSVHDPVDWISIFPWELMLSGFWKRYQHELVFEKYLQEQSPSLVRILQPTESITLKKDLSNKSEPNPVLSVLFIWADPRVDPNNRQFSPTQGDDLTQKIKEKFEGLKPLLVTEVLEKATINEIADTIQKQHFDIVHILTHGDLDPDTRIDHARLLLDDGTGNPHPVTGNDLTNSLCQPGQVPQIVFLQACQSATTTRHYQHGIAQSLIQGGVNFVVAMQAVIGLSEALTFAKSFYQQLVQRQPIDLALLKARAELVANNRLSERVGNPLLSSLRGFPGLHAWAVPVLFMNQQAANGNGYLEQGSLPKAILWEDDKVMILIRIGDEAFYVDKYPVTAEQYANYLKLNKPSSTWNYHWKGSYDYKKMPATNMTVDQAQQYAEHYGKHIPTLERWQQAASGGGADPFPWGDTFDQKRCHVQNPQGPPSLVNCYPAQNDAGIYDIVGNVAEMASKDDRWYHCGGSYKFQRDFARIYNSCPPQFNSPCEYVGFRCIAELADYVEALRKGRKIDEVTLDAKDSTLNSNN
ncbi:MAG: hypothetical protein B0A82_02690 [Alkalinema sp. CACIAM 70d]|nr:MAG: hypothetical protein B0A82_02690 [Alkalinema sp. CACIAM 70d]